jgi:hypothetical protein
MITANNEEVALIDKWLNLIRNKGGEVMLHTEYEKLHGYPTQENQGEHKNAINRIKTLLLNHSLIQGTPRTGMDQGYILSPFGNNVLNAGGIAKYFEREQREHEYTEALTKSSLIVNRLIVPIQAILTIIIAIATCYQCHIYHEQLAISQRQLQLQEQSSLQKNQPSLQSSQDTIRSYLKPIGIPKKSDSSLTQ